MATIQRSFLWAALALQAGCFSTEPSRPQPYPIPDPSVFASLSCEDLAYKRDGYQQLLQNVVVDHPSDSHLYIPMYQANAQGLSNAMALRNCAVSGQTSAAPLAPLSSSESYCFAYYTSRNMMEPITTATGVVSEPWQTGSISGAPARVALTEFQTFLTTRVNNEPLGPVSCNTVAQLQDCSVSKIDSGSFSHGAQLANVICSTSREGVEKGSATVRTTHPLLQVVDWRPSQASAIGGSSTVATSSSVVAPALEKVAPVSTSSAAPPPPSAATTGPALSTSFAAYAASETPERYRGRSCDYLHARLIEIRPSLTMEDPEVQKWAQKAKAVVSQVLVDNHCGPASWVGGRVGGVISTIDPIKAPRLKLPLTGVWVEKPLPGGSFEKAGILRGDTIVAVNDIPVADASEFFVILLKQPIGSTIRVKFWRVRTFMELPVVVASPAA